MRAVLVVGLAAAAVLGGCSSAGSPSGQSSPQSSSQASPSSQAPASEVQVVRCPDSLSDAFSQGGTATVQADVSAGLSTCGYRTRGAKTGACPAASVTINTNPQPFKDFQRWVVETTQNAGTARLGADFTPQQVDGIGIEADWVPATYLFETANNERWIAVQLTCPSPAPANLTLAKTLARAALAAG